MNPTSQWYQELIKPTWAPPSYLFGPVWTVLYTIIAASFGFVFYKVINGELPKKVALPFILNIISNAAFTPLQFVLQNNILAAIDIIIVLATIIWFMKAILPYYKWVAYVNIPYFIWVTFATFLQINILFLNF
jgi:translocator protein